MPSGSRAPYGGRARGRYGRRVVSSLRVSESAEAREEAPRDHDDETPQRILVAELRALIDRANAFDKPRPTDLGRVAAAIYRNPKGIHAKFVLHGLSKLRVTFLYIHKLVDFDDAEIEWLVREDLL